MSLSLSWWIMVLHYRSGSFSGGACSQGEHNPLPLMSKGENEAEDFEVAISPKGEIVGIMFLVYWYMLHMLYLMATPMAWLSF